MAEVEAVMLPVFVLLTSRQTLLTVMAGLTAFPVLSTNVMRSWAMRCTKTRLTVLPAVDLLFAIIVLVIRSLTVYLLKSDWSVWTVKFGMVPLGEALAGYQAVMVTAPVGVLGK